MKICAISVIKNEEDIIESFVRYTACFVDHILIMDNGSSDKTVHILNTLASKKFPLEIFHDPTPVHTQDNRFTRLLLKALDYNPDYIFPLDADEFINCPKNNTKKQLIKTLKPGKINLVAWKTYVPHEEDLLNELFIPGRMPFRRSENMEDMVKTIIPVAFAKLPDIKIVMGNHFLQSTQVTPKDYFHNPSIKLAHYPIRSTSQIMQKAVIGWISTLAKSNKQTRENYHWKEIYDQLKENPNMTHSDLMQIAFSYSSQQTNIYKEPIYDPLDTAACKNIACSFTSSKPPDFLGPVLTYVEELAHMLAQQLH